MGNSKGAEIWASISAAIRTGAAVWLDGSTVRARQDLLPDGEVCRLESAAQVALARSLLGRRKKPSL